MTEGSSTDEIEQIMEKAEAESEDNSKISVREGDECAMKKYSIETVVGIFVVIGLICVAYMTVKLGKVSLFG